MCPGGEIVVFDTVLTPVQGADSSHAGYASPLSAVSLLLSNGGDLGDSRALVRFIPRGDTLILDDTTRSFTVDSALITLFLQARDTTVGGLALDGLVHQRFGLVGATRGDDHRVGNRTGRRKVRRRLVRRFWLIR